MYHFQINGIDVTCETAEELHAIANFHQEQTRPIHEGLTNFETLQEPVEVFTQSGNGHAKRGPRPEVAAAWAKARRVHKRRGLTVREAFSRIMAGEK